jgi:hypothetical protein
MWSKERLHKISKAFEIKEKSSKNINLLYILTRPSRKG